MSLGLVGRKVGMTRIFAEDGASIPVTVLDVSNNRVTQVKTPEIDGYAAIQVAFGKRRASRVSKPLAGHLAKAGVEAGQGVQQQALPQSVGGHDQLLQAEDLDEALHDQRGPGQEVGQSLRLLPVLGEVQHGAQTPRCEG